MAPPGSWGWLQLLLLFCPPLPAAPAPADAAAAALLRGRGATWLEEELQRPHVQPSPVQLQRHRALLSTPESFACAASAWASSAPGPGAAREPASGFQWAPWAVPAFPTSASGKAWPSLRLGVPMCLLEIPHLPTCARSRLALCGPRCPHVPCGKHTPSPTIWQHLAFSGPRSPHLLGGESRPSHIGANGWPLDLGLHICPAGRNIPSPALYLGGWPRPSRQRRPSGKRTNPCGPSGKDVTLLSLGLLADLLSSGGIVPVRRWEGSGAAGGGRLQRAPRLRSPPRRALRRAEGWERRLQAAEPPHGARALPAGAFSQGRSQPLAPPRPRPQSPRPRRRRPGAARKSRFRRRRSPGEARGRPGPRPAPPDPRGRRTGYGGRDGGRSLAPGRRRGRAGWGSALEPPEMGMGVGSGRVGRRDGRGSRGAKAPWGSEGNRRGPGAGRRGAVCSGMGAKTPGCWGSQKQGE